MRKLVLLRHGESTWNKENRFTGWTDVPLSPNGVLEARKAGQTLSRAGFTFDVAFSSVLRRAITTLDIVLDEMDLAGISRYQSWRLNERYYGALQGLNKSETAKREGDEQVRAWRRSFLTRPPTIDESDERYPGNDPKYAGLAKNELPHGESLKDTMDRVIPYWESEILPVVRSGKRVVIAGHGSMFRAFIKHIDKLSDAEIEEVDVPYGFPLVYEFDEQMMPIRSYYLGDDREIKEAIELVRRQAEVTR